jgi:hypothetical protein
VIEEASISIFSSFILIVGNWPEMRDHCRFGANSSSFDVFSIFATRAACAQYEEESFSKKAVAGIFKRRQIMRSISIDIELRPEDCSVNQSEDFGIPHNFANKSTLPAVTT